MPLFCSSDSRQHTCCMWVILCLNEAMPFVDTVFSMSVRRMNCLQHCNLYQKSTFAIMEMHRRVVILKRSPVHFHDSRGSMPRELAKVACHRSVCPLLKEHLGSCLQRALCLFDIDSEERICHLLGTHCLHTLTRVVVLHTSKSYT